VRAEWLKSSRPDDTDTHSSLSTQFQNGVLPEQQQKKKSGGR
jgi:hypothetical protein